MKRTTQLFILLAIWICLSAFHAFDYFYRAHVEKVYDGDTVTLDIDLGLGIIKNDEKVRLYGIDAPEVRGSERPEGLKSRDALRELILDKDIKLETIKDKRGKYGRLIGILHLDTINVNDWLVRNGYAEKANY